MPSDEKVEGGEGTPDSSNVRLSCWDCWRAHSRSTERSDRVKGAPFLSNRGMGGGGRREKTLATLDVALALVLRRAVDGDGVGEGRRALGDEVGAGVGRVGGGGGGGGGMGGKGRPKREVDADDRETTFLEGERDEGRDA